MAINEKGELCALVTNIQKYTIHDGPGIRTEIFFKGCPLNCLWCSNPEAISPKQQLGIYPAKCINIAKCGLCKSVCEKPELIHHGEDGLITSIDMADCCISCLKCADICPARAIKLWGEKMTVEELMNVIREDLSFYRRSGGGVTFSGGEVMLQWEFICALAKQCREENINVCIESALHCSKETMIKVMSLADLVITDIKHMDSEVHRSFSGRGNEQVLENIRELGRMGKKVVVRTPVVIGYNATEENIRATAEFLKEVLGSNLVAWQLLPYRKMGTEKYDSLNIPYPMGDYEPPERDEWEPLLLSFVELVKDEYAIPAVAGSSAKLKI